MLEQGGALTLIAPFMTFWAELLDLCLSLQILQFLSSLFLAKLSQAPAPAELSLALFPSYPATRPDPTRPDSTIPDPTGIVFSAISQPVLNAI